jgi:hypothetical protein
MPTAVAGYTSGLRQAKGDVVSEHADAAARRERYWLGIVVAAVFVAAAVMLGVVAAVTSLPWGVALVGAGLLVVVCGGVWIVVIVLRRRGAPAFARSPLWELAWRERRQVARAIRRGQPVAAQHRNLAVREARRISATRWVAWMYAAISLLQAANLLLQTGLARWSTSACAVMFAFYAGYWHWLCRRAVRFVRQYE